MHESLLSMQDNANEKRNKIVFRLKNQQANIADDYA